jgi:hypothetical protein
LNGIEDRSVARAATDMAVKALLDNLGSRRTILSKEGIHVDDETRCAEATLTGIVVYNALLHGMQTVLGVAHALYSGNFVPIHSTHASQACIHGHMRGKTSVAGKGQHDSAGTTSALFA